jgi:hypothetical protein
MKSKEHIPGVIYRAAGKSLLNGSHDCLHGLREQSLRIQ